MIRRFFAFGILLLLLVKLASLLTNAAQAEKQTDNIDYIYVDMKEPANSIVLSSDHLFVVYGPRLYRRIPKSIPASGTYYNLSGTSSFDGYVTLAKRRADGNIIVAGVRSQGIGLDTRQDFIAMLDKNYMKPESLKKLSSKYATALITNVNDSVLLSNSGEGYTLTVFGKTFGKKGDIDFGAGQDEGDVVITSAGNYGVLGFEKTEDDRYIVPTYWEYSPKFDLIQKLTIGRRFQHPSHVGSLLKLFSQGDNIYAVYGWSGDGKTSEEDPDMVTLTTINSSDLSGAKDVRIPYYHGMKFFMGATGPYVLYPKIDHIKKIEFDMMTGKTKKSFLNRPLKPIQCFPSDRTYDIIDVITDEEYNSFIAVSSKPLDTLDAGCLSIGKINW